MISVSGVFLKKLVPLLFPVGCIEPTPKTVDIPEPDDAGDDAGMNELSDAGEESEVLLGMRFWNSFLDEQGHLADISAYFRDAQASPFHMEFQSWEIGDVDVDGHADFLYLWGKDKRSLYLKNLRFAESVRRRYHGIEAEAWTASGKDWNELDAFLFQSRQWIDTAFNNLAERLKEKWVSFRQEEDLVTAARDFRSDPVNPDRLYSGLFFGKKDQEGLLHIRIAVWEPDVLQNMAVELYMTDNLHTVITRGQFLSEETRSGLSALMEAAE